MANDTGKLIVIYGVNNLGKTTQAKLLAERLRQEGHRAGYYKYPIYDIQPSGALINNYLREGNTYRLSPREFQLLNVINRMQFEPIIREKLAAGINIVAEDYRAGGIAWGMGDGVAESFLTAINEHLLPEDIVFLFDGERFTQAVEGGHKHETDAALNERVRDAYLKLAAEHGWITINANQPIEVIHQIIWNHVKERL